MIPQNEVDEAIEVWINYQDSDQYDEDKAKKLIWARITIREALKQGYKMVAPNN